MTLNTQFSFTRHLFELPPMPRYLFALCLETLLRSLSASHNAGQQQKWLDWFFCLKNTITIGLISFLKRHLCSNGSSGDLQFVWVDPVSDQVSWGTWHGWKRKKLKLTRLDPLNFQCFCKLLISAAFIRVEAAKLIWLIINYGQADESWQPKLLVYEIWIWFQSSKVKKHKIFCMFCIFLENPRRLHWIFYFIKPKVLPIDPPRQLR